ncbi:hypothetical protein B9Z55_023168 [Caenorhabditis nigoni]|nr:hypothetical protein B9Z55_023168 [Caenorhabditis nigoni]
MDTDSTDNRQQPIIMMVLEIPALDSDGNEHLGTVFFESDSNASYIKSNIADKLKITPNGTKQLHVDTFRSNESHSILSSILSVKIKAKKDTVTLDLCEVAHIANDIITTKITDKICHHLAFEKPVKLLRQPKNVDILIGLDHYLLILGQITSELFPEITGVLIRIQQKPVLISADIEKEFLQLEFHPENIEATRLL